MSLVFILLYVAAASYAEQMHDYVSKKVWEQISPFLLPPDHPIKGRLDRLFSSSRVILNLKTLKAAGFQTHGPRRFTRLIVAKHPEFPGYIFKLYVDAQRNHKDKPDYYYWLKRVKGARLIYRLITENHLDQWFKVPQKWIYPLPPEPSPPSVFLRKNFILVQEDMDVLEEKENEACWESERVSFALLSDLFFILQKTGLADCAKPHNIPFSRDGKIAFIDTQTYHQWPVKWKEMVHYLSAPNRTYWKELIENEE